MNHLGTNHLIFYLKKLNKINIKDNDGQINTQVQNRSDRFMNYSNIHS